MKIDPNTKVAIGPLGAPLRDVAEVNVRCKACGHRARDHEKGACGAPPRSDQIRAGSIICGCTAHFGGPLGSPQR